MQRYLINHLTNSEFIILLIAVIGALAIMMSLLSKRYFSSFINYENNDFIGLFIGSVVANYGFVIGFIIITLWREFYEVKTFIVEEADYLSLLVYNSSAFPSNIQSEIMSGIERYITVMIQDEWPSMRLGKESEKAVPALSNLFHIIQSYVPTTEVESTFYKKFVDNLNQLITTRDKRLEYLESSLIDIIRFMLVFGAVVILFLVSLLECKSSKLKILSIVLVSGMLSLNLGLVFLLDYPLEGHLTATSEAFTKGILKRFNPENRKNVDGS